MTGSGYISASQDKMKSTYDSVQEQTGLFAGNGGFDVTVGRHTQLDGAVIASTATGVPVSNEFLSAVAVEAITAPSSCV